MKIGLYGRISGMDNADKLKNLVNILRENAEICIYHPFWVYLQEILDTNIPCEQFSSIKDIDKNLNCLLSAGGDGTFLEAAQFAIEHQIPILGINFGRLGFLAQISANDMEPALKGMFEHNYDIEKRSLISVYNEKNEIFSSYALNEVTIQRNNPTMLKTTVWINDELLSSYWSDGILVSTPTGSTAYSLSVGGPVVLPDTQNFVITPISPHNLNIRPIIISDKSEISIEITTRKGTAALSMDNKMFEILSNTKVKIKKSQQVLNFMKLKDYNFFKTLRTKLNWGIDIRN
ncbi:MAG: NAD kinase [Prevotellaceae bacterium]|jgi:NAD+ kinase|nr:NAD kinase [Prevotellaceae bacterium]